MKEGIVIGCVDCRLHDVLPTATKIMGVDKSYMFRVVGPDGMWRDSELDVEKAGTLAGVRRLSSVKDIEAIAFIGHTACAGHPVSDEEHRAHIIEAAQALKGELETEVPVFAIVAQKGETDQDWSLEPLGTF